MARLDIEDVSLEVDDGLENIVAVLPYKEGSLLMLQQGRYSRESVILRYDPKEEEAEALCAFTHHEYSPLKGLA